MSAARHPTLRRAVASVLQPTLYCQRRHARVAPIRFLQTRTEPRVVAKYQDKLKKKLESAGVQSYEELKEVYKDKITQVKKEATIPEVDALLEKTSQASSQTAPSQAAQLFDPPPPPPKPVSPIADAARKVSAAPPGVKTLSSFVDLDKLTAHQDAKEIEFIWRARFMNDKNSLCAVIPSHTYKRMEDTAKQHPMFILPLPREGQGVEIHLLQWTFPTPESSAIIFTSLEDYKLRGEFAVPHTTLTHHLELSASKNLVLAQGSVIEKRGINVADAQLLVMSLQKFYAAIESEPEGRKRKDILQKFSSGHEDFKLDHLIEEVETIN